VEISIPILLEEIDVVDHNVVDTTKPYDSSVLPDPQYIYDPINPDYWQDDNYIWEFTGTSFSPTIWALADEATYEVDQIVYKDSLTQEVTGVGEHQVAQQPENYTSNNTTNFDNFTERYSLITTSSVTGVFWNLVVGNTLHSLYQSTNSPTGWWYRVQYTSYYMKYGTAIYQLGTPPTYVAHTLTLFGGDTLIIYWKGSLVYQDLDYPAGVSAVTVGTVFAGTDGNNYRVAKPATQVLSGTNVTYYLYVEQEYEASKIEYEWQEARVLTASSLDVAEDSAVSFNSPSSEMWVAKTAIVRGTDLYIRTNVVDPMVELTVYDNVYNPIMSLENFKGFSKIRRVNYLLPFDGKNYTTIDQTNEIDSSVYYIIKSPKAFDTVALSGLIAENIGLVFRDSVGGTELARLDSYTPHNFRDQTIENDGSITNHLPDYPTTAILYSTADEIIPAGGVVEIYLYGPKIELGTLTVGTKVDGGFTNLAFTNKFNDYSPKEVDQWGNVLYIEGVKQSVFNGTVDVRISDYDMITRLMTSIGGSTVILNGSGATENQVPSSNTGIFASTMLIGRLKDFQLKTKITDNDMDVMASYTFTLEENI